MARSDHQGAAASLAQDPGRPATGTRRRCLCAPVTPARSLPATRARYPRIPGSRWPLRPGRPRARCPGRRCCSWRRCSPWPPLRGPQVRTCGTLRSVDCLFLCSPACHSGDTAPALTLCSLGACLVTNLCILLGRVRTRWVWALDTARWSWASGHLQHERIGVPSTASWNFQESGDWNLSRCPGEQGKGKEK